MKELYAIANISKQGFWKQCRASKDKENTESVVLDHIRSIRQKHKRMSCRKIFYTMKKSPVGRDNFERIGLNNGYKVRRKKSYRKTTQGQEKQVFPNLLRGKKLNDINQAIQSDIFYYSIMGKHYYGFTIEDIYSRRLLALYFAKTLKAEELIKALKQAVRDRNGHNLNGCLFHSDRGRQYIAEKHLEIVDKLGIELSMCKIPQENAYVERIQGTLKEEYLDVMELNVSNLNQMARKIKYLYNYERPHQSLNMKTPVQYEEFIRGLEPSKRPELSIFEWDDNYPQKIKVINKEKSNKKESDYYNNNI